MASYPNEVAWAKLFASRNIGADLKSKGEHFITADEMKKDSGGREPRLLSKFDSRASRVPQLRDAKATVLAVNNGRYCIVAGDGYHDIEAPGKIEYYYPSLKREVQTLDWNSLLTSESQVLDAALVYSLMCHFTGESELQLTIRGRTQSPDFSFDIGYSHGRKVLDVSKVQIEIDGGYEGEKIYLIEAKMGKQDDFIVRQLYYPYRAWLEKGVSKEVVPIFVTYSNRVFSFRQYRFSALTSYDSIELVRSGDYIIGAPQEMTPLVDTISSTPKRALPDVPFPQANDLTKVIDIVDALASGYWDKEEIAGLFEYDPRQSDYYGNAARFLGLAEKTKNGFSPTSETAIFAQRGYSGRIDDIVRRLSSLPIFGDALEAAVTGSPLGNEAIVDLILSGDTRVNRITAKRRASTVTGWVRWVLQSHLNF